MEPFRLHGIVPIVPTPFHEDESIDLASLQNLIEFAENAGAGAVCLPAYASEFYKLSEQERALLIEGAVRFAAGRLPVVAQINCFSTKLAIDSALAARDCGASAISMAVPRLFALSEQDLFRHFARILADVELPFVIQDFHPNGQTISPGFVADLHKAYRHFAWVKLEEPRMGRKVEQIRELTGGEVGVLEGWGGMYMLELIPGICGVMSALSLTDLLGRVFHLACEGQRAQAEAIFERVLPQIVFSLQSMELFHHAEKLLLQDRGLLSSPLVREASTRLEAAEENHIRFLNDGILRLLKELGMPCDSRAPAVAAPG